MTSVLSVTDLTVVVGGVRALDGVTFGVARGEAVAVIGPNGAGKTTLLDAIAGDVPLGNGAVVREPGATIGRLFQSSGLPATLTVGEVVSLVTRDVDGMLRRFGLLEHETAFVAELSTGMRRIADLATALAGNPALLLLDEPASGLARAEVEALAGILARARDDGTSILFVEHDTTLVRALADSCIVMDAGRVVARGAPADVLAARITPVARAIADDERSAAAFARIAALGRS